MSPLVSVIIPTYNYASFLAESIGSVISQTYERWELIIIDDGSTDNTHEVVKPFLVDDRITYLRQENAGVSTARNKGLELAKGKYIQFLDADDILDVKKFEVNVSYLLDHPEIDVVYSDDCHFDHGSRFEITIGTCKIPDSYDKRLEQALRVNPISTGNPLVKASAVKRTRGFVLDIKRGQDWLFWFEMIYQGSSFGKCRGVLYMIRRHNLPRNRNYIKSHLRLREEISKFLLPQKFKDLSRNYKYWFLVEEAQRANHFIWVMYFTLVYLLFVYPKSIGQVKIFLGDILGLKNN